MRKVRKIPYIKLTMLLSEEEGQWVALCRELGTAANGESFEDAHEALLHLVEMHLNALETQGERARFLREYNIKLHYAQTLPRLTREVKNIPTNTFVRPMVKELAVA